MAITIPRLVVEPQIQAAAENRPALKIGSRGNGVIILQQALIDLGFAMPRSTHGGDSLPDGIFGVETDQVVKRFQQRTGLAADGAAGRLTFQKLEEALINDHNLRESKLRAEVQISAPIG
jgi:peptidoglycan hydrolase-like protein with peptidoglycan-binding domain